MEVMRGYIYEISKISKSTKNKVLLVCMFLSILGGVVYFQAEEKAFAANEYSFYSALLSKSTSSLKQCTAVIEGVESGKITAAETYDLTVQMQTFFQGEVPLVKTLAYYNDDLEKVKTSHYRIKQNEYFNYLITAFQSGLLDDEDFNNRGLERGELKAIIHRNNYILDHDLNIDINPYSLSGVNMVYMLIKSPIMIIIIVLLVFMIADLYFEELRKGSYKVVYSQSIKRSTLVFSKVFATMTMVAFTLAFTGMVAYLLGFLLGGHGQWTLPVSTVERINTFSLTDPTLLIITSGEYILKSLLLLFATIVLLSLVILFVSMMSNQIATCNGVLIFLLALSFFLAKGMGNSLKWTVFYPFKYLFVAEVMAGNQQSQYYFGLSTSVILSLFLVVTMVVYFNKKDLLG